MVTKKKKRHAKDIESTKSKLTEATRFQPAVNEENRVNKAGLFENPLKHWWAVALIAFLGIGVFASALKYLEADARNQIAERESRKGQVNNNPKENFLSKINPFLANPTPSPAPELAKEYIYAGSRLLAVEDAGANAAPPADLAVWRPSSGNWYVMGAGGTLQASQQWGQNGDKPAPGDYDGDGKTDFCVFRPTANIWYAIRSSNNTYYQTTFGATGDKLVPADYDGDGKTDIAVYRGGSNGDGTWYSIKSSDPNNYLVQQFGLATDIPTPKDFDGDGKADFAVWRDDDAAFYALRSSNSQTQTIQIASSGSQPVPADYDGDGKADAAVWSNRNNHWMILQSSDEQMLEYQFGDYLNDVPVQNDYDGDGKVDIAVWRFNSPVKAEIGDWHIKKSSDGSLRDEHWGMSNDFPVPAFWRR